MTSKSITFVAAIFALMVAATLTPARAVPFVLNGSLEDLNSSFVNDAANYDQLAAGATSIANWTVSAGITANIAWGQSVTDDGRSAPFGSFFVDLTGFGSESPDGAIEQMLSDLLIGGSYSVSLYSSGTLPLVTIGGVAVALVGGPSIIAGIDTYTLETGMFTAVSSNLLLKIANNTPGAQIVFVDNIAVDGPAGTVSIPEPGSLALFAIGLVGLGYMGRRRKAA